MEQQIASLAGLVHHALSIGPDAPGAKDTVRSVTCTYVSIYYINIIIITITVMILKILIVIVVLCITGVLVVFKIVYCIIIINYIKLN